VYRRPEAPGVNVSITMPFHDAEAFIAQAVESVLAQTREDWELILVDDGSQDGSRALADAYARLYPDRIAVTQHEGGANLGISASRQAGWIRSRGRYVLSMDADDVLLPHGVDALATPLERHASVALSQINAVYWHSWSGYPGADADYVLAYPYATDRVVRPPLLAGGPLIGSFPWPSPGATMFRRDRCPAEGPYDPAFPRLYEDFVAYLRVVLVDDAWVGGDVASLYRQHRSSVTATSAAQETHWRDRALRWAADYVAAESKAGARARLLVRYARLLHRHPRVARLRRRIRRIGRTALGHPRGFRVPAPPELAAELRAYRKAHEG